MLPPSSAVLPAASVVTLVKAVLPPTAPPNVVVPAVLTVRLKAPSTVPPSVTFPDAVEVNVVFAPRLTASLYACAPLVVTLPPLSAVLPAASVVTLVRAELPPTAPPNVVVPAVFTVRLKAPSTVPPNVTFPELIEVNVVFAPRLTASLYDCAPLVVTLPPLSA